MTYSESEFVMDVPAIVHTAFESASVPDGFHKSSVSILKLKFAHGVPVFFSKIENVLDETPLHLICNAIRLLFTVVETSVDNAKSAESLFSRHIASQEEIASPA